MAVESYTPALFSRVLGWNQLEIEVLMAKVQNELKDRSIHLYLLIYMVYGQKPWTKSVMSVRIWEQSDLAHEALSYLDISSAFSHHSGLLEPSPFSFVMSSRSPSLVLKLIIFIVCVDNDLCSPSPVSGAREGVSLDRRSIRIVWRRLYYRQGVAIVDRDFFFFFFSQGWSLSV